RGYMNAVIGEHAVCGGLFERRYLRRSQGHGQIRWYLRTDPEAMRIINDRVHSQVVCQLECGNVARLCQCPAESDIALELFVVIVRDIWTRGSVKNDRRIFDGVVRTGALIHRSRVNVWFERRPNLAQCLGGTIELWKIEVAPAKHGLNVTTGIIEGHECALRSRVLLQTHPRPIS